MTICFIGNPLSGKSTIAKECSKWFNYLYFSTGDYFRALSKIDETEAIRTSDMSKIHNLDIVKKILSLGDNVVLDGYPRDVKQAKKLKNFLIVFVSVKESTIVSRLERNRDKYDSIDIAIGRFNASLKLRYYLSEKFKERFIVFCNYFEIGTSDYEISLQILKERIQNELKRDIG